MRRTCLMVLALLAPAAGAAELRKELAGLGKQIVQLLEEQGKTEVAVGEFTGPPLPSSAAGPLIQAALVEELGRRGVKANEAAAVVAKGEYFILDEDSKADGLTVRVTVTVRTNKGKKLAELNADVDYRGNEDIVKLLAMNVDLEDQKKGSRESHNEKLKKDLERPPLKIDGTKVKVSPGSPFSVELLKRPPGGGLTPLTAEERKGCAFAGVARGEEYVVRLTNGSTIEAAASVTIDGVDAFQFYEGAGRRPGSFLIPAGKSVEVRGWPRGPDRASAFLVGSFADSPAARVLKSSARLGTITVCFHHSWEKDVVPDEYKGSRSGDPDATTLGRDIGGAGRLVPRTVGPLQAAVSLRYSK